MWHAVLLFAVVAQHTKQASCTGSPVFVRTGQDLILDGKKPSTLGENDDFTWRHNTVRIIKHNNVVGPKTFGDTEAEFFVQNFSLLLKNVKKNESGNYGAWVYGQKDVLLAEYQVIVLDPVLPGNLRGTPSSSSDSCRLSVICTTQDAHVNTTVRCNNGTCSQEGGEASEVTASGASLRIYLVNDSIICNHSNQVSWAEDLLMIEDACTIYDVVTDYYRHIVAVIVVAIVGFIAIILLVLVAVQYRRKKGKYQTQNTENTIYDVAGVNNPAQPDNQTQENDCPSSTYCLVGPHSGSPISKDRQDLPQPESLYAQVEKPAKP